MNRTVRVLRLWLPGGNPLARGTDRLQGALLVVLVALGLLLLPVMLTVGSLTYAGLVEASERQAREWHRTVAVLTEDAPAVVSGARAEPVTANARVMARWRSPDGTTRTGRVLADNGSRSGARVTVWLDQRGTPVDPPAEPSEAAAAGVLVAVTGWLAAAGLLTVCYLGACRLMDRRRLLAWDEEWTRVEPEWRNQPR